MQDYVDNTLYAYVYDSGNMAAHSFIYYTVKSKSLWLLVYIFE